MVSFIAFLLKKAFVTHIKTYFLPAVYGYFLVYNSLIHLELAFVWCKLRKCFPTQPIIQNKCFFKKKILQDQSRLSLYFTNYHINSNVMGRREKKKTLKKTWSIRSHWISGSQSKSIQWAYETIHPLKGLSFLETTKTLFYHLSYSIWVWNHLKK